MSEAMQRPHGEFVPVTPDEISTFLLKACAPDSYLEPAQQELVSLTERLVGMNSGQLDALVNETEDPVYNAAAEGVIEDALSTEYDVDEERVKAYQDVAALAMVVDGRVVSLTGRYVPELAGFGDCRGYALAKILQGSFLNAFFPNLRAGSVEDQIRGLRILEQTGLKPGENLFPGVVQVPVTTKETKEATDEQQILLAVSGVLPTRQFRERIYRFPSPTGYLGRLMMKLTGSLEPEFQNGAFDAALAYRLGEMLNNRDDFAPVLPQVLAAARFGR